MRTALLTTALIMVAAMAWADEPTAPTDTKTDATAQTTPAAPAQPTAASSEATATATTAVVDDQKPLRPPAGYRPKRVNGEQVWCAKLVVLGSRFPKEDCRNEAELRELIRIRESMRTDMEQRLKTCSSSANGGCGMN